MDWKKIHLYLYTFCRYFIATMIISYAFAKIFETQFTSQPSVYDKPIGSLSGFQLTWYYYGYSYWYGIVIATTQIISALLLFFRKTTRIGIILFLTFMVNILLVDFAYNIEGAKGMAFIMTMMGLFIFLSDYKNLIKYFINEPLLFQDTDRPNWLNKISKVKYIYIPFVFIGFFVVLNSLKNKYMGKNEFYGAWENIDNSERLYFEAANTFQINKHCEHKSFVNGEYEIKNDSITLNSQDKGTKMHQYIKGKYQLKQNQMIITTKNGLLNFKKIR